MALNARQVPMPDPELSANLVDRFDPSPELGGWVRACFIEVGGELENEDQIHLQVANIGYLWTNVANTKKGAVHYRHGSKQLAGGENPPILATPLGQSPPRVVVAIFWAIFRKANMSRLAEMRAFQNGWSLDLVISCLIRFWCLRGRQSGASLFQTTIRSYQMTKTIIGTSLAMFLILTAPAFAQEIDPAIDTDGDGAYSLAELQAAFPNVTEEVFVAMDANESGTVDVDEFAVAKGTGLIGG